MTEDQDVLEHNLRRLFARGFAPVAPAPAFRARLVARLEAEIARGAAPARWTGRRGRLVSRSRARLAAIAAGIALLALTWLVLEQRAGPRPRRDLAEILAEGRVALQRAPDEEWTPLDADLSARGLDLEAGRVAVATPRDHGLRVRFGARGHVDVAAGSRVEIARDPSSCAIELMCGAAGVERYATGESWIVRGAWSAVDLERGSLSARLAPPGSSAGDGPCLVARLERGAATLPPEGTALQVGVEITLRAGHVVLASADLGNAPTGGGRVSLAGPDPEPSSPPNPDAPAATTARLRGACVPFDAGRALERFRVTLLRHERLPDVSRPRAVEFQATRAFAIEGLASGTYDVYVEAPGFGVWSARDVDLPPNESVELSIALQAPRALRGRVVDPDTGRGIEGAVVLAEEDVPAQVLPASIPAGPLDWQASTRTGPDGRFELGALSGRATVVRASCAGFGPAWSALATPAAETAGEEIELRLTRAGRIAGSVAHDDGRSWANAVIVASRMASTARPTRMTYGLALSDADGRFAIEDLAPGTYVLINVLDDRGARAPSAVRQIAVAAGRTTTADIPERAHGARVTGRLSARDGTALADHDVTLQPAGERDASGWLSVRTRADGSFAVAGVRPGSYDVFVGTDLGARFAWQARIDVQSGSDLEVELRLDAGALRGRLVRADDGSPIGAAFLLLEVQRAGRFEYGGRGTTSADGAFAFPDLRFGTYRVTAFPGLDGLAPAQSAELWLASGTPVVDCALRAERGASLRLTVRDSGGTPVVGAELAFADAGDVPWQFTADDRTDARGELWIPGLAAGRWTVRARAGSSSSAASVLVLAPGETRELALALAP